MPRHTIALAGCVLLATPALAQWSDDANLVVADQPGEQVQPKVLPAGDGGVYISWFDNAAGGYDVRLQRLDAAGVEQWVHDGILVADRGFSSTQDYGLAVDGDGTALLTFRDDRFGGTQITVARVEPDGTMTWGPDGVQVTADGAFHAAPSVAATDDGGIVVAWTNDSDVKLQRLDAKGAPQWGAGVVITDASAGLSASDLQAATGGDVIVSWVRAETFNAPKHIECQKLDAAGTAVWNDGDPVSVFDGGSLQFGNFPDFLPDGSGGAVFTWYEVAPLQCRAQHILADGTEAFPHNGSEVSTDTSNTRSGPDAWYDAASGDTWVFWIEGNGNQSQDGLSGQRFDSSGARQWGPTGVTLLALSSNDRGSVRVEPLGTGVAVALIDGASFGNDVVRAARVEVDGSFAWAPPFVDVSQDVDVLARLRMTATADDEVVLAWQRGDFGVADLVAQNLNADGTLGRSTDGCSADLDGNRTVDVGDLVILITAWGTDVADLDGDGTTSVTDLVLLFTAWGPC